MATYKVLQDIESEDKLFGPLTMRQFIYAVIAIGLGFISFRLMMVKWFLGLPLVPPAALFFVLAAPFGHDQPSEVWLLAKIRYFLKPHRRIWDQSGVQQLVTITAPKRVDRQLANNLSQTEVKSRLHALADTLDSRGWAIKNVNVNLFAQPSYGSEAPADSDRLVDPSSVLVSNVPNIDIRADEDMLDTSSNPTAQHLDQMVHANTTALRQKVVEQIKQAANPGSAPATSNPEPANYWFLHQNDNAAPPPGYSTFGDDPVVAPGSKDTSMLPAVPSAEDNAILKEIHDNEAQPDPTNYHTRVLPPSEAKSAQGVMTPPTHPAILNLADRDDLNVSTIARQARRERKQPPDDEVVISLHQS